MEDKIAEALDTHKKLLKQFEKVAFDILPTAAQLIADCLKNNGRVYLCGNGGSAADCQHIAGEFVNRFKRDRRALPAIALSTDTSVMTSIANDYSFEDVFSRQVEAFVGPGDILWAISTSGFSANVISAAKLAREKGAKILAFTGRADTPLEHVSDLCFCIDAPNTASAQEIHQIAYHIICDLVETDISRQR